uniref:Ig-like domain-containing protein n=1 Tax=Timema douglasi TaxID=61478 RepID=A0A7R8VU69_TIMDO|nr:unnamed protein product [Timema douglasi]
MKAIVDRKMHGSGRPSFEREGLSTLGMSSMMWRSTICDAPGQRRSIESSVKACLNIFHRSSVYLSGPVGATVYLSMIQRPCLTVLLSVYVPEALSHCLVVCLCSRGPVSQSCCLSMIQRPCLTVLLSVYVPEALSCLSMFQRPCLTVLLSVYVPEAMYPRFAEKISNVTVTVGRDALLACVVDNLRGYKNKWSRDQDPDVFMEHTINFYPNSLISGPDRYGTVLCSLSRPLYEEAGFKSRRGSPGLVVCTQMSSICYYSVEPSWWSRGLVRPSSVGLDCQCVLCLQVAWVRVDTQTILSIHHNVITQNPRISLSYNDHRSWYLHIKNVHETDRGWYMCQVNTDPMRSRQGYLQVVGIENNVLQMSSISIHTLLTDILLWVYISSRTKYCFTRELQPRDHVTRLASATTRLETMADDTELSVLVCRGVESSS